MSGNLDYVEEWAMTEESIRGMQAEQSPEHRHELDQLVKRFRA